MHQREGSATEPEETPEPSMVMVQGVALTAEEVRRLDHQEYAAARSATAEAAKRLLALDLDSAAPSVEVARLAQQLATAAGQLRWAAEWLLQPDRTSPPQ